MEAYCLSMSTALVERSTASPLVSNDLCDVLGHAPEVGVRARAITATLGCFARFGVAKTTIDDVARASSCSRATLYRAFPGGKDELIAAVVSSEVQGFFAELRRVAGAAETIEELLVGAITSAISQIERHAALNAVVGHEPELIWPHVAFQRLDRVLAMAAAFFDPYLEAFGLEAEDAQRVGEWIARIVLSHVVCPSSEPSPRSLARRGGGAPARAGLRPAGHHPARVLVEHVAALNHRRSHSAPPQHPRHRHYQRGGSTQMASSIEDMIDRSEIDDIEAILSVSNTDVDAVIHTVRSNYDTIFTWNYEKGSKPKLGRLYEKAKTSMWNAETDLDWSIEVDQEKLVQEQQLLLGPPLHTYVDLKGTSLEKWGEKEWIQLGVEGQNWTLSQFMHGEQGALVCTAKVVESVPWIDAKYYGCDPGDGRGPPRRGVRQVPRRPSSPATTRSTPTSGCCSTTSSPTAAGT